MNLEHKKLVAKIYNYRGEWQKIASRISIRTHGPSTFLEICSHQPISAGEIVLSPEDVLDLSEFLASWKEILIKLGKIKDPNDEVLKDGEDLQPGDDSPQEQDSGMLE